jgi:hypothetical protein
MINPYLARELRRAESVFRKSGASNLAMACFIVLGDMADTTDPDEHDAIRLIRMAFGDPIHV